MKTLSIFSRNTMTHADSNHHAKLFYRKFVLFFSLLAGFRPMVIVLMSCVGLLPSFYSSRTHAVSQCVPPPANMVSWWTADRTATDLLENNNGKLVNGATYAAGKVDEAFNFDDSKIAHVSIPDSPSLNVGTGDFTLEAWIKTDSTKDIGTIQDKRQDKSENVEGDLGYVFYLGNGGIGPGLQMIDGENILTVTAPTYVADGKFHHVAVIVHRNRLDGIRLFVDGQIVLTADPTSVSGNLDNTAPFLIGGHAFDWWRTFDGLIDELSLYKRALDDTEIKAIFAAGTAGKCKGNRFATFNPRTRMTFGAKPNDDSFHAEAAFTLHANSNGIHPATENVRIKLGNFSITIPAGKFVQEGSVYAYDGTIDQIILKARIHVPEHG